MARGKQKQYYTFLLFMSENCSSKATIRDYLFLITLHEKGACLGQPATLIFASDDYIACGTPALMIT